MVARKRKAAEDDWLPTVPAPSSHYYHNAVSSQVAGGSGSYATNPYLPTPGPSQPPPKRQRKKKDPDAPAPEKRAARHRKTCPQNILERVERVRSQRFFMIGRERNGSELREKFSVLGSTGNVYTVTIGTTPTCDCPDSQKGNHCKHILFIFLKVLQVTQVSGYWYQKALLTNELEDIFTNAPAAPADVANARVQEAYAQATGRAVAKKPSGANRRIPEEDTDCPVCYETLHKVDLKILTFCETCGNGLHTECFQQWVNTARGKVTCVFCRSDWPAATGAGSSRGARGARSSEGYLNLSQVAGVSPVRDTSSYYHGPRRGSRFYGYQDYDDLY